jgi:uncharacterized protein DUF6600/FecR-like protein
MVNRPPVAMRLLLVVSVWALAMPGLAQTSSTSAVAATVDASAYSDPNPVDTVEPSAPEPAHVAYIDGAADVTHDGRAEPAAMNVPLVSGDQVRTREGRVEVLFGDGSVLDIDQFTTVDFLSDELVRLTDGRIRVTIGRRAGVSYRVDTPSAAVRIEEPGEYRISLIGDGGRRDVELVAVRGYATLVNELGETGVRAGERAFATDAMAPSYAQAYNSAAWDAFDRWAEDRRGERTGAESAQYLPDEIRGYAGEFDRAGAWQYDVSYGYVWYPRVRVDWRPYYHGRWSYYGPWGWTWIAYDRWGWPTHHYGRWGFRTGAWFWIPSRRWAPAYVYWAGASDYVGWCPLGWDNRPIFSIINVNIQAGRRYRGYDPYRAWTVVPRRAFGRHVEVGRYAVARSEIDRAVPRWYVSGASAPIRPALSTRDAAPIYSAGRGVSGAAVPGSRGRPGGVAPSQLGTRSRAGARSAEVGGAAPVSSAPTTPVYRAVPRATPPASAGALAPARGGQRPSDSQVVPEGSAPQIPRARGRYRDHGPGGADRSAPPSPGAPSGVPSGGIYGQRGVPRTGDGIYAPGPQGDQPPIYYPAPSRPSRGRTQGDPSGVFAPGEPRSGVFAPGDPDSGVFAPRRSEDRPNYARPRPAPSYGPPPAAPSPSYGQRPSSPPPSRGGPAADRPSGGDRGGERGGERATPRGGGGTSSPSRPSGGHARPRPQ